MSSQELTVSSPTKLMYSDCSGCSQLLLVDNAIENPSLFASSVNDKTFSVTYGWSSTKMDVLALLRSRFTTIDRIAIAFSCQQGSPQPFLDNQVFFTASETFPYSDNLAFIISLVKEFKVKQIDYLGCSTLTYPLWNQYYSIIKRETSIIIGASNDQTGNIKYGGDWTLESTGQDIESVYFTKSIQYYNYLLDAFYTTLTPGGNSYAYGNILYKSGTTVSAITGSTISTNTLSFQYNAVIIPPYAYAQYRGQGVFKSNLDGSNRTLIYSGGGTGNNPSNNGKFQRVGSIVNFRNTLVIFSDDGTSNSYMIQIDLNGLELIPLLSFPILGYSSGAAADENYIYSTFYPFSGSSTEYNNYYMYKIDITVPTPTVNTTFIKMYDSFLVTYNNKFIYACRYGASTIYKYNTSDGSAESPDGVWAVTPSSIGQLSISGTKLYASGGSQIFVYNLTDYSLVCFKEDSLILTDQGYRPVQDLRKGDMVRTSLNGYIPIDMIGKRDIYHPASQERIKDQLYECSPANYPDVFEPLVVTGCHSILVFPFASEEQRQKTIEVNGDAYVTDHKFRLPACVDERATVFNKPGNYTIYHFALDNDDYYMNYGVYANGLLVETCSKRYLTELANMELIE